MNFENAPLGWSQESAITQAEQENITLTDGHWDVIRSIQSYCARHEGGHINTRELLDALEEKYYHLGGKKHLYRLFPGGPIAQGCRLAGIHPPAGSTDYGFGSVQ